ncbi:thioredoxin family protein [Sulfurospirillum sp. T05]|uniref:Thioredoxin family protein n=1 Tax=Sulfurospirillum tamanense TaxID=2813362 RepID=A0ABS2WPZ1_9BACT|nr:thioredoxin family protein [Sulfurospirillum tamanensis]MBN2963734.1 thioredoxin family protein [Sulfurospirillum tamanensis]
MALIESALVELGTPLQHFALEDPNGKAYGSKELMGKTGLLIYVVCNHCPYNQALWERLVEVAEFASKVDVGVVAINPNIHPNYPEDSPAHMLDKITEFNLPFPYLIDHRQKVARSLGATCTPDIFLFDGEDKLFYHGRVDDYWKDASKVKKEELRDAITLLFSGKQPPQEQMPSMGCSIKWTDTITG